MFAEMLLKEAEEMKDELVQNRHAIHGFAEVGFALTKTKEYVKKKLFEMGYDPIECGKCGILAMVGEQKNGKVFLLRADMDALPMAEEADVPFASINGNMHACGHDMHTAMLLGAAKLLKAHEEELKGMVKLMFQPAEELFEGAQDMIGAGVLENPSVDAGMMVHVMAGVPLSTGTVVVSSPGVSAPAADYFTVRVKGKGCHGSTPQQGIDSLTAAAHILIAFQELQARELSLSDEAVLTVGRMNGGTAANVIADVTVMEGTIRTYDEVVRAMLKKRMAEIAGGIATAFRASAEITFGSGCPTLVNDQSVSACVTEYTTKLLGKDQVYTMDMLSGGKPSKSGGKPQRSGGSEDFAYVSQQVPAVMLALAAGDPAKEYPLHHPKVTFEDSVLSTGSAVYAYNAMEWLKNHK